ncbi:MAG: FHA domain-containing protein [Pirellula sp.]|nr:FHA domain-containing protein [Pirellula sp.]
MIEQEILELKIDTGEWAGQKYSIPLGALRTVGRERGADFVVEIDPTISRIHFEINFAQKPPQLRDRGSSNGTVLNGRKITQRETLNNGDTIRAGKTTFSVEMIQTESNDSRREPRERSSYAIEPPPVQMPSKPSPAARSETPAPLQEPGTDEVDPKQLETPSGFFDFPEQIQESSKDSDPLRSDFVFIDKQEEPRPVEIPLQKLREDGPVWIDPFPPEVEWPSDPVVEPMDENTDEEPYPSGIDLSDFDNYQSSSPIDESRKIVAKATPQSNVRAAPDNVGLRRYRLHKSPEIAYPSFLSSLFEQGEFLVVAHFRKIGKSNPSDLVPLELFPNAKTLDGLLPMAFLGDDWARFANHNLTRELVANDAIVTLLGRDCMSHARTLNQGALPGFSVADGFLGWFWPSQLKLMLTSSSDSSITNWFRNESLGLVFPNNPESCIDCIMHGPFGYDMESLGFDRTRS